MVRALLCGFAALSLAASAYPALAQIHDHQFDPDPQVGSSGNPVHHEAGKPHKAKTHKAKAHKDNPTAPASKRAPPKS